MILGYEQPVDIPVMSIYNQQAIKDYVGAVQKDYEQGVKEFNDFRDKYGDFVSPIEGASEEYYNTGVGSVMNVYDNLRNQGIDPIRSIEGRGALMRAINNVDRAKLARMRQSAETVGKYLDNVQKAKAAKTFDPVLEGIALRAAGFDPEGNLTDEQLGNNPLAGFDNNQLWTRVGPEQKLDIVSYFNDKFSKVPLRTKEFVDSDGFKRQQEYRDDKAIDAVVDNAFDTNNPSMKLLVNERLQEMRQVNPDTTFEQAEKSVKDQIKELGKTNKPSELDPGSELKYKENQQTRRARISASGGGNRNTNNKISIFDNAYAHYDKNVGYGVSTYNPAYRMQEGIGLKTGINGDPFFDGKRAGWLIDKRYANQLFIRNHENGGISRITRTWGDNPNKKGRSGDMYQLKSLGRVECVMVDGYPQYFDVCEPKNFKAPGHEILVPIEQQIYSGTVK